MVRETAITKVILSLTEAEDRLGINRTDDENFFPEWTDDLPTLSDREKESLDLVRRRFLYHRQDGSLAEGTVKLLIGAPLLEIAGFYDSPYKIQGEPSVELVLDEDNQEEILRGRIDVLVVQGQFWIVILESKRTTISALTALPQALAYMAAAPISEKPVFAMLTNGDDLVFVKLAKQNRNEYDVSAPFSPFPTRNQLYTVLKILKRIGTQIAS